MIRNSIKYNFLTICLLAAGSLHAQQKQPNILFCIADDASYQHMSAYGFGLTDWVKTPGFDRVANEGLLFTQAFTPNAKCAPSRAAILTGRNSWQLEEAGNHNSYFPAKFGTFVEQLGRHGYMTGFTGKGWGPGEPGSLDGNERQLTGREYNDRKAKAPTTGITPIDYAGNFEDFLSKRPKGQPFCFWYGSREPHRAYEFGSGAAKGKKSIKSIKSVPPFWIDNDTVRNDMLDYAYEVEYFDSFITRMIKILEAAGELENTIIVVTSDNGMPFPRIKGHMYEFDNHLPLAIMWKDHIKAPGRKINDFVSFIDFAPTFLDLAGIKPDERMQPTQGSSLKPYFSNAKTDPKRDHVLLGREREDVGRPHDQGYPVRAIVKGKYFFSINYKPERWPSGNPETGYLDTDGSPTKSQILSANRLGLHHDIWQICFGKQPALMLFDTQADPYSMHNLAYDPKYASVVAELQAQMVKELKAQGDPRQFGKGDIFDNYPYAENRVKGYYERRAAGEKIPTPFVNQTDFEKPGFDPEHPKKSF